MKETETVYLFPCFCSVLRSEWFCSIFIFSGCAPVSFRITFALQGIWLTQQLDPTENYTNVCSRTQATSVWASQIFHMCYTYATHSVFLTSSPEISLPCRTDKEGTPMSSDTVTSAQHWTEHTCTAEPFIQHLRCWRTWAETDTIK